MDASVATNAGTDIIDIVESVTANIEEEEKEDVDIEEVSKPTTLKNFRKLSTNLRLT